MIFLLTHQLVISTSHLRNPISDYEICITIFISNSHESIYGTGTARVGKWAVNIL